MAHGPVYLGPISFSLVRSFSFHQVAVPNAVITISPRTFRKNNIMKK
jgi:hypothetical protein